ncbi:hypothetical protein ACIP6P_32750 [Streptomyces sp. NPDC088729]
MDTAFEIVEAPVSAEYIQPAMVDLGTVTGATLGHAGANHADDTQYYSNW